MALLALYHHGSSATGDTVEGSDVDLLGIVEHSDDRDDARAQALEQVGDRWPDPDLTVLALDELDTLHYPMIAHGTQLCGEHLEPVPPSPSAWAHDAYRASAACVDQGRPVAAALWSAAGRAVDAGAPIPTGKAQVPALYRAHVGDLADVVDRLHAERRAVTEPLELAALEFLDAAGPDELRHLVAERINAVPTRSRAENLAHDPQSARYKLVRGALSPAECARVIDTAIGHGLEPRRTYGGIRPPEGLHTADIGDGPIAGRLERVIRDANATRWRCDVSFGSGVRVHRYQTGAALDWHLDLYPGGSSSKLFAVALLSEPTTDYDGGALSILDGPEPTTLDLHQGDVLVAPSWLLHMVDTITAGTRWSATLTMHGRPWR